VPHCTLSSHVRTPLIPSRLWRHPSSCLQAAIARDMQATSQHGDRYVYTTHSFLISLFLDCPPGMGLQCPNSTTTAAVTDAIKSGAITWHAHPHNAQYEFYDTSLLQFSFDLTHDLDRRFGLPPKHTAILVRVGGWGDQMLPDPAMALTGPGHHVTAPPCYVTPPGVPLLCKSSTALNSCRSSPCCAVLCSVTCPA
jgi:hypothetical protein